MLRAVVGTMAVNTMVAVALGVVDTSVIRDEVGRLGHHHSYLGGHQEDQHCSDLGVHQDCHHQVAYPG